MRTELQKLRSILTREEKWWMVLVLASMLLVAALEVVSISSVPLVLTFILEPELVERYPLPEFLSNWVERTTATERLVWGGSIFLAVFSLRTAAVVGSRYLQLLTAARRQTRLAARLFQAYMQAPYEFYLTRDSSELVRNLQTGTMRAAGEIVSTLLSLAQNCIVLVAVFLLLLISNTFVTLVALSVLGVFGTLFAQLTAVKARQMGNQEMQQRKLQLKELRQVFEGMREIKISGSTEFFSRRFNRAVELIANAHEWKIFLGFMSAPLMELLAIFALLLVPALLMHEGHSIRDSVSLVSMYALAFFRLKTNISSILGAITSLRFNFVNLAPIYDDLVRPVSSPLESASATNQALESGSDIVLDKVSYRYPESNTDALRELTLRIPAGSRVAIVGPSGSGKSTLLDVLLGILQPTGGEVTVGQVDIHASPAAWHARIAHVPQRTYLLNDSLKNNIALGVPGELVDETRIRELLRQLHLEEFVDSLPDGLETSLGERGLRISGGQQQRISIARALYRRPSWLFMDEPTAALDNETELALAQAFRRLPRDMSIITVSHRQAFIEGYDYILNMDSGRITSFTQVKL